MFLRNMLKFILPRKRVLVIDDDPEIAELLAVRLQAGGYRVFTASDGEEGWSAIRLYKPNLVIIDVMMPKIDGFDLLRILRGDPHTHAIPVIMLTAKDMMGDVEKGFSRGADAYFCKPYDWVKLSAEINRLLS